MSLKDRMGSEIKAAMKAKDKLRLETVRGVKKLILDKESEVRAEGQTELTEEQEMAILTQMAKQRRDAMQQYTDANRTDLADKEAQELTIIQEFLPAQLSDADIEAIIDTLITETGASGPRDMGKVMGPAMKRMQGKADGSKVQQLVKAKLSG